MHDNSCLFIAPASINAKDTTGLYSKALWLSLRIYFITDNGFDYRIAFPHFTADTQVLSVCLLS